MIRLVSIFKVILLCMFISVQAVQAEHLADLSHDVEHADCLDCKSLNQPFADATAIPELPLVAWTNNVQTRVALDAPKPRLERADPARAPPYTV